MPVPGPILCGQGGDDNHGNGEDETDNNEDIVDAGAACNAKASVETEHDDQEGHGDTDDIHDQDTMTAGWRINVVWLRPLGHNLERRELHGGEDVVSLWKILRWWVIVCMQLAMVTEAKKQ